MNTNNFNQKLKILHVLPSLNLESGGVAQGVINITSFYEALGAKASALTMDNIEDSLSVSRCLTVHRLGKGIGGTFSYHPNMIKWLKQNVHQFDAVIIDGLWQYHDYAVYKALKNSKVPYYIFTHGMLDPWFKHKYPFKHLKKYLFWFLAQHAVLKNAKAVLFTCEDEKILARESFWPYKIREHVVGYGTTITEVAQKATSNCFYERYPELRGKRLFLFLSRINEKKGCDLLIEAFAKAAKLNNKLHLIMAGPDQTGWQADLEKLAIDYGIADQITWTGMIKNEIKWGAMKAAEVFILPSHQENFGIAVAEALAMGTPVLISDKVNIWREIKEMNAGLVESDNIEGIQKLLQGWLALSPEQKKIIQQNAIPCFEQKFDIAQAAKNLIKLIQADLKTDEISKSL